MEEKEEGPVATVTVWLTEGEEYALKELVKAQELTPARVMVQGLRLYQLLVMGGAVLEFPPNKKAKTMEEKAEKRRSGYETEPAPLNTLYATLQTAQEVASRIARPVYVYTWGSGVWLTGPFPPAGEVYLKVEKDRVSIGVED